MTRDRGALCLMPLEDENVKKASLAKLSSRKGSPGFFQLPVAECCICRLYR